MIFSVIGLSPSLRHRRQLVEILRSMADLTRLSAGCRGCWLSDDDCFDNHIRSAEQWETEEAVQDHIRAELFRRVLAEIELSHRKPEVCFFYPGEKKGFEFMEDVRPAAKVPLASSG